MTSLYLLAEADAEDFVREARGGPEEGAHGPYRGHQELLAGGRTVLDGPDHFAPAAVAAQTQTLVAIRLLCVNKVYRAIFKHCMYTVSFF